MLKSSLFTIVLSAFAYASPLLESSQSCADVTVIFARGTSEPPPLGLFVGPPFKVALQKALGGRSLNFVGVEYPADNFGYLLGGSPVGIKDMAKKVNLFASSCPNTAIVISGYSQGAQIVHRAANQVSPSVQNRIKAAVTFGDPFKDNGMPGGLNDRFKSFCALGDTICMGPGVALPPHLTYAKDTPAAAQFVVSHI